MITLFGMQSPSGFGVERLRSLAECDHEPDKGNAYEEEPFKPRFLGVRVGRRPLLFLSPSHQQGIWRNGCSSHNGGEGSSSIAQMQRTAMAESTMMSHFFSESIRVDMLSPPGLQRIRNADRESRAGLTHQPIIGAEVS